MIFISFVRVVEGGGGAIAILCNVAPPVSPAQNLVAKKLNKVKTNLAK